MWARAHGFFGLLSGLALAAADAPVADAPFLQETHVAFPLVSGPPANDLRALTVTQQGQVWTASPDGVRVLLPGTTNWLAPAGTLATNPAFALVVQKERVWVGAWNGLHGGTADRLESVPGLEGPIAALAVVPAPDAGLVLWAAGPDGLWRVGPDLRVERFPLPGSRQVRALAATATDELWLATGLGLLHQRPGRVSHHQGPHTLVSSEVRAVVALGAGEAWAGGLGGLWHYRGDRLVETLDAGRGLPHSDVQCLARARSGELWAGTSRGLARFNGREWSLRHSRRWLLDDDVRALQIEERDDGELTAWVATAGGVSRIDRRRTTLADKARHYHAVNAARHVRPPGIVEKCRLRVPGDVTTWEPQDDDNDGGYTAVHLAMESFRYGATGDPEAGANARRSFEAMRFLLEVTGNPGFIARTVIPASWTRMQDPNETPTDAEWAARRVDDPRSKRVVERWRRSRDGQWLWKADTSSDEITAHLFGAYQYATLVADAAERGRVRDFVCAIVDHLLAHDYQLVDLDGQPTRWGVWAPAKLWHDPDWANEAGINAVELLSYLKLAHHLSGDERYDRHYRALLDEHRYRELVPRAKNLNPAGRTHIDDELLAFAWPALIALETDPELRTLYRDALERWHTAVRADQNPFFEMLYAGLTGQRESLPPVIDALRDQPLDLVRWTVDNSGREDVRPVRRPELEQIQTDRLLLPSERGTPRTDENPWRIVQGDGGVTESDGVFWLLPYWMGRQQGFLAPAAPGSGAGATDP